MPTTSVINLRGMAAENIDSDQYVDGSIDAIHLSANSVDSDAYVDGSIDAIHLSANSVDSDAYVDASIDNAHLADDAVGIAELSATGTASSSTFLRGDNAWAAAGGGWAFVSSATASTSATLAFTNMVTGYDYEYLSTNIFAGTTAKGYNFQIGVAGPTYRTSGYITRVAGINGAQDSHANELTTSQPIQNPSGENSGLDADEQVFFSRMFISDPVNASHKTSWLGQATIFGSTPELITETSSGFYQTTAEANTSIKFFFTVGNIVSGTIFQYRRKRS